MRRFYLLACSILLGNAVCSASSRAETPVTVFAAASLKGALSAVADAWTAAGHAKPRLVFDSSGTLAHQIEQGAPAAIFVSADERWMDELARMHRILQPSRSDLLTNTLVLVVPAAQQRVVTLERGFNLAALLGPEGRLSVGDPATVPAGIYGRQALTALGVWDYAQHHLAPAANVKAALLAVELGEAPAGIVYGTDARGDNKVAVAGTFPATTHDPITYPLALVAGGDAGARALFDYMHNQAAGVIYRRFGFGTP